MVAGLVPYGSVIRIPALGLTLHVTDKVGYGTDVDIYSGRYVGCESHVNATFGAHNYEVEVRT